MTFTHRELWIYIMTIMHTSVMAQKAGKSVRQANEIYLRTKLCPTISNDEWLEIEKDIVAYKRAIQNALAGAAIASLTSAGSQEDKELLRKIDEMVGLEKDKMFGIVEAFTQFGDKNSISEFKDVYNLVKKNMKEFNNDKN